MKDRELQETVYMGNLTLIYNESILEEYKNAKLDILVAVRAQAKRNLDQILETLEYQIGGLGKTLGYEA